MVRSTVEVVVRVKPRASSVDDAVTVVDDIEVSARSGSFLQLGLCAVSQLTLTTALPVL